VVVGGRRDDLGGAGRHEFGPQRALGPRRATPDDDEGEVADGAGVKRFVQPSEQVNARRITSSASIDLPPPAAKPRTDFVWFVRKDLADVGLFSKPTPNAEAEGAELSWSRNNITRDTIWQVDGLFAVAYTYLNQDYSPFIGVTIAPYLKVNRELHSALSAADNNADTITVGGSGEIGFNMPKRGANYFRAHWSETEDHIANSRVSQVGLEWIPTYLRLHREIPGTYLTYNLNPELRVDYDRRSDGLTPIGFSGLNESLRIGPQAKFLVRATDFGQTLPDWAQPLLSFRGSVTYHWWTEVYSGKTGSWLDASLGYNLDRSGNVALAFSYKKGRNEESAKLTDLFKISLNVKTCAAFFGFDGKLCGGDDSEESP